MPQHILNAYGLTGDGVETTVFGTGLINNTWSIAELSFPRRNPGVAALGDKILFCGGNVVGDDQTNVADKFDLITEHWSSEEMPFSIGNTNAVVLNGKAYFGGTTSYGLGPIINIYSGAIDTWELGINFEEIINSFKIGVGNGKIFVMGQRRVGTSEMVTVNISSDWWDNSSLKNDIMGNALISYKGSVYSAGGLINGGTKKITGVYRVVL